MSVCPRVRVSACPSRVTRGQPRPGGNGRGGSRSLAPRSRWAQRPLPSGRRGRAGRARCGTGPPRTPQGWGGRLSAGKGAARRDTERGREGHGAVPGGTRSGAGRWPATRCSGSSRRVPPGSGLSRLLAQKAVCKPGRL